MEDVLYRDLLPLANILCVIVSFVSLMMIIYGGFKYVFSVGDPYAWDEAKMQTIYGVFGFGMSIVGAATTKWLNAKKLPVHHLVIKHHFLTYATFFFVVTLVMAVTYFVFMKKIRKEVIEEKDEINIVTEKKLEPELVTEYNELFHCINRVKKKFESANLNDIEMNYVLNERMEKEMETLFTAYQKVNEENKENYRITFFNTVEKMKLELESMEKSIEMHHVHTLEKTIALMDKRYEEKNRGRL